MYLVLRLFEILLVLKYYKVFFIIINCFNSDEFDGSE